VHVLTSGSMRLLFPTIAAPLRLHVPLVKLRPPLLWGFI